MQDNTQPTVQGRVLDMRRLGRRIIDKRKVYYWVLPITFVLSSALILCVPREYTAQIVLAPEASTGDMGGLGSLASSFGFDIGGVVNEEAIHPSIYPNVIESTDFILGLFGVEVQNADRSFQGSYYDYLRTCTRYPFWRRWGYAIKNGVTGLFCEQEGQEHVLNPYMLTRRENGYVEYVRKHVVCTIDKKTDLILITVCDQDKMVCAQMADSTCSHMQQVMTDYRTRKNCQDMAYYRQLIDTARQQYDAAARQYIGYADSHSYTNMERYRIESQQLQEEMNLRYNICNTLQKQYIASQSKMLENVPVFTTISSARVPIRPAKPKRMLFVLGMLVLATIGATVYVLRDEIFV